MIISINKALVSALLHSFIIFILLGLTSTVAFTQGNGDGTTPSGMAPGSPMGAFNLSDFEHLNLYNGNLSVSLPLLTISGRGDAQYTMMLPPIEQHWSRRMEQVGTGGEYAIHVYDQDSWFGLKPGLSPGVVQARSSATRPNSCSPNVGGPVYTSTLMRLTFTTPDGTEHELRDQQTNGQPHTFSGCGFQSYSRGRIFVSADGSNISFVSDQEIVEDNSTPTDGVYHGVTGDLMLPNGTRYRVESGKVTSIRDRNGNLLTFSYTSGSLTGITDSLNRRVSISGSTTEPNTTLISFKGSDGTSRTIKLRYGDLQNNLSPGNAISTLPHLFPGWVTDTDSTPYNPFRASAVELPDGRSYQFRYNAYAELTRVVLPTGAVIAYDHTPISGGGCWDSSCQGDSFFRRTIERRVYPDGVNLENRTTYTRTDPDNVNGLVVLVSQFDSQGELLKGDKHYFFNWPTEQLSMISQVSKNFPINYSTWKEGKEYETEALGADGTTALRRVENTWQQPLIGATWPLTQSETSGAAASNDPQITQSVTTLVDSNQVLKQAFAYDRYSNRTDVWQYDFEVGSFGSLIRHTHTDFLTTNSTNSIDYTAYSIHLCGLPTKTSVYDSGGKEKARTTFEYDDYSSDVNHAPLLSRSGITGLDGTFTAAYSPRGNLTRTQRWLLSPSETAISRYFQYDLAGNTVKFIDARGNAVTIAFDDNFGSPDGSARGNTAPMELSSGQSSFAFPSLITNALGHTVYDQSNYYTGRTVDSEDPNGIVTSNYYGGELDRLVRVIHAAGTSAQSQTTINYDDYNRVVTTTSDLKADDDNLVQSKVLYDGLGRAIETRQYEGGTNYLAVQEQYDALGRAYLISNPFRPWQSQTPVWTQSTFDPLGRTTKITSPDGAMVSTVYLGNAVTVTDQAGKSRKNLTDGLGRLSQVYEDPAALNYVTSYGYDVLDNLTDVTQSDPIKGTQTRTFVYNSLKQLATATNPESGTVNYSYDANGNLQTKTDARGIVTSCIYDALNRNITITYTNDPQHTPTVHRYYDGYYQGQLVNPAIANSKGRLWRTETDGTYAMRTSLDGFDPTGRPLKQESQFYNNGWSSPYITQRTYNVAGAVVSQSYPSGHVVYYNYDPAGRLLDAANVATSNNPTNTAAFSGNLGDGVMRGYASRSTANASYDGAGRLIQEQFGTLTPLYNRMQYSVRGQMTDIRLSSSASDTTDFNRGLLQFAYTKQNSSWGNGVNGTDNNGNLVRARSIIPLDPSSTYNGSSTGSNATFQSTYEYDALNRLSYVAESLNGASPDLRQQYDYDRWGNRTINQNPANTFGTNVNTSPFEVEASTNRLYSPGDSILGMTQRRMQYDASGNQTNDSYTGSGYRVYDAENRLKDALGYSSLAQHYNYDGDGRRAWRIVDNVSWWQIYGMDGALLAEYTAGAASFIPHQEYGYRDGQLLVTAQNGDEGRLQRYVDHFYKRALGRDATSAEMTSGMNSLAAAGNVSTANLADAAKTLARSLFNSTEYTNRNRSDQNYVLDLYLACYQRPGDSGGVSYWVGQVAGQGRPAILEAFLNEPEFAAGAQVLEGNSTGDNQRTDQYINWVYNSVLGRDATSTELATQENLINSASATGQQQVVTVVDTLVRGLFNSTEYVNRNRTDTQYVTDLYWAYLQFGQDQGGIDYWAGQVPGQGRTAILNAFASIGTFHEIAGTLYREVQWLVPDQLGTPRMIAERTGNLAGIKRHDYLPFGEELYLNSGGRTTAQGFNGDDVRQKFTSKERDGETGLDYSGARYYGSRQGRFGSADETLVDQTAINPQTWNLYSYVTNNPLNYIDPTGYWKQVNVNGHVAYQWENYNDTWESLAQLLHTDASELQSFFSTVQLGDGVTLDTYNYALSRNEDWNAQVTWTEIDQTNYDRRANKALWAPDPNDTYEPVIPVGGGIEIVEEEAEVLAARAGASGKLSRALTKAGVEEEAGTAAHHIVPIGMKGARVARAVLSKFNIEINSAENGVRLPSAFHSGVHTADYVDKVNTMLSQVETREEAISVLKFIGGQLKNASIQ